MKQVYADNSATTKVRDEVIEAMLPLYKYDFGNPSSIHSYGRKAKTHLNNSRKNIASLINSNPEEIYFTSGGTESNNLAIFGITNFIEENKEKEKHIITSKIEHPAVKTPIEHLEKKGWEVTWLNTNKEGFVDFYELEKNLTHKTALVSIMHGNNEIGTIQNIQKISALCREKNVLFHTDAVQTFGKIPMDLKDLKIDLMSFSSHKIYGPKGVGGLYINSNVKEKINPIIYGGGQEFNLRSGTENLPCIVGFSTAAKLLKEEMSENINHLLNLQTLLEEKLLKIPNVKLTGPKTKNTSLFPLSRIPGLVNICVKNLEGENLVLQLDLKGIACSSGSACASTKNNTSPTIIPSYVLEAIGISKEYIRGSLRFSLGKHNTEEDVNYISQCLRSVVEKFVAA